MIIFHNFEYSYLATLIIKREHEYFQDEIELFPE